ncbi:MAG: hypothetical protein QME62_06570 [Armatimonadota bacterium]|nr:hypothetical protein [Armatimonadota bacterium]
MASITLREVVRQTRKLVSDSEGRFYGALICRRRMRSNVYLEGQRFRR